jgi:hypothetical protein
MKQIYINTMLGTTRIDYNENDDGDLIIVAPALHNHRSRASRTDRVFRHRS